MLTEKEKHGIRAILDKLKTEDLFSLTFTVTKGFIKPENKHEALQATLLYCEKASLLLRRKKIKKDILFSYLRDEGLVVSVSAEKKDYIKECLQLWGSTHNTQNELLDDVIEDEASVKHIQVTTASVAPTVVPTVNPFAVYCSLNPVDVVNFGQQFVSWYFGLSNQCSTHAAQSRSFGMDTFVSDCCFTWLVRDCERIFSGSVQSQSDITQVLTEMVFANCLILVPAVEGVLSRYDPHGIMQVKVEGVVHQMEKSTGIFEQCFGLFRDVSSSNSWKIKKAELKMQVNVPLTQALAITM